MDQQTLDIMDSELAAYDEAAVKAEKRQRRFDMCQRGHIMRFNPETGRKEYLKYHCDLAECDMCMATRGDKFKTRVERALEEHDYLWMSTIGSAWEADEIKELVGKRNYMCLPQDSHSDEAIVFYASEEAVTEDAVLVSYEDVDMYDWLTICRKRDRKRTSGALGGVSKAEDRRGKVKITVPQLIVYSDDFERINDCAERTHNATGELNPGKSVDEVREAVQTRISHMAAELDMALIEYVEVKRTWWIDLTRINWLNSNIRVKVCSESGPIIQQGELGL